MKIVVATAKEVVTTEKMMPLLKHTLEHIIKLKKSSRGLSNFF